MINIVEMLEASAERVPERTAFSDPDGSISFGELLDGSQKIAGRFIDDGCMNGSGRSVLFYMEKCVNAMPVMFAASYCRAFYCFVDIRQSDERAADIIKRVDPSVIVTDEKNSDRLKRIMPDEGRVFMIEELTDKDTLSKIDLNEDALKTERDKFCDRDILYVNFTSGSTGMPKGVAVSQDRSLTSYRCSQRHSE